MRAVGHEGRPDGEARIKVVVVDDDALVRAGLHLMLDGAQNLSVVGEVADGADVVAAVERLRPDVVLMDIKMARLDGITATKRLRARPDTPQVVILTNAEGTADLLAALEAGAAGYLLKDSAPDEIVTAIQRVHRGEAVLSSSVTRSLLDALHHPERHDRRTDAAARLSRLSDTERAVAELMAEGLRNPEIAERLYLSVNTVKSYVSRIFDTLVVGNRVEVANLVREARERG